MNKYILYFLKPMRLGVILSVLSVIFLLFSQTMIYRRITESFKFLFTTENLQSNPYLFKFYTYKKLVSGDLYEDTNFLLGSGPSTFTSRSSVIRMPEERVNSFPIELPYFKSEMFNKHISPAYANWRKTKESYGNFASPQTTVISVAAELGLLGVSGFAILFYSIIKTNKKIKYSLENRHLQVFVKYLTLYFILCLFHLNFWEYPIVCFTYIIMVFTIFNSNKTIPTV